MSRASFADRGWTQGNADVLPRPRLASRLARALDRGSVVAVAPAGYGKTTALAEAVALRNHDVAWLHCSEADRDAGRLLVHMIGAVQGAVPGAADVLGERLEAAMERVDARLAVEELVSELRRLLVDPLIIVVDDAEHLANATEAEQVIAALLAAELANVRVAIASRRPLSLRAARQRLAGRLTEVGPADLAFGADECAALLRLRVGREASREDVEVLWSATEGWPLGVALAARPERAPAAAAVPEGGLDEYLAEELLDPLEQPLRDALIDSSVARELDPLLVRALGLPEGFLEEVRRRGVPLRAPAVEDPTFAYHPLVRDHLAARLARERPAWRRAQLHAVVAQTLEERDRGLEAIEHWLEAGQHARAGEQVARHGEALLATSPATVAGWLARLPRDVRAAPGLKLLEGRLVSGMGRMEEAERPLRDAVAGYAALGEDDLAWGARAALSETYLHRRQFEAAIRLADGYGSGRAVAARLVALAAAAALAGTGRYPEASELFADATAQGASRPLRQLARGYHAFFVEFPCGQLDAALAGVRETMAHLERADPFSRLPHLLGMAATIHEERGEPQEAVACFAQAERVAARTVLGGYVGHFENMFRASIDARAGNLDDAERALARATGTHLGWFSGDAHVTRAAIAARRGAYAAVDEAVEAAIEAGALDSWPSRFRTTALLVPVLVEAGRPARARDLVDATLAVRPAMASCARLLALRAWLRNLEGDDSGALADLALAWEEAGDGRAHLVRRERARLEPLLWKAVDHGAVTPETVVVALEAAVPGGAAVLPFTRHPVSGVRRAAVLAAVASGHPQAAARARELERDPDPDVSAAARAARAGLQAEPPPLVFTILGGFSLRRGAFSVDDATWRRRAAQRLVRVLLLHRDAAMGEDALFAALWPDKTAAAARRNLQVIVSAARAVLDWPDAKRSVLRVVERSYRLALSERDVVDADEFERAAAAALGANTIALLEAAAGRWTGEPLPGDRYEDWAASGRERLIDLYRRLLDALAIARSAAGDHPGAVDARRRQVELDPLDEGAQRGLMLAYARAGRRGHALRQYLACRRALVDGLGIEPAQETAALQRLILAGDRV